jgi:hypothetical protein
MNASGARLWIVVGVVLCLALAGCQTKEAEEGPLVKENELVCPIENLGGRGADTVQKIENGTVNRAEFVWLYLNCEDAYIKGWMMGLADGYDYNDGTGKSTGYRELVTDQGGVWKGMFEENFDGTNIIHNGTYTGEGIYDGLQMVLKYDGATQTASYRVTFLP